MWLSARGQSPDLSNTQAGPSRGAKRRRRSSTPAAVSQGRQNKRKAPPPQSHQSSDDASDDSSDADSEGQAAIEIVRICGYSVLSWFWSILQRRTKAAEKALQADLRKIAEVKKIESQIKKQIEIGRKAKETRASYNIHHISVVLICLLSTQLKLQGLQENIEKLERQRRDLTEEWYIYMEKITRVMLRI